MKKDTNAVADYAVAVARDAADAAYAAYAAAKKDATK